jgi:hypothetical protein
MRTTTVTMAEADMSPETLRVFRWRLEWLRDAGYSAPNAEKLALRTDIDWHDARDLLRTCGSQEQALSILL